MSIAAEEVLRQFVANTNRPSDVQPVVTLDRNNPESPLSVSYQKERPSEGLYLPGRLGSGTRWLLRDLSLEAFDEHRRLIDCHEVAWVVTGLENVRPLNGRSFVDVYRELEIFPCPQRPYASPVNPALVHFVEKEAFRNQQNPYSLLRGCKHTAVLVGHIGTVGVHLEKRGRNEGRISTFREVRENYMKRPELDLVELYMPVSVVLDAVR